MKLMAIMKIIGLCIFSDFLYFVICRILCARGCALGASTGVPLRARDAVHHNAVD